MPSDLVMPELPSRSTAAYAEPIIPTEPLGQVLTETADFISSLSSSQYTLRDLPPHESSIGKHMRHIIDHGIAWIEGVRTGYIDYDSRKRGTTPEVCPFTAANALRQLAREVRTLSKERLRDSVNVRVMLDSSGLLTPVQSTLGRELVFIESHTIHHNALVAIMARSQGIPVPDRFGYAPSTIAWLESQICAR